MKDENVELTRTEWQVLECLWNDAPKTVMQIVKEMKEKAGWAKSTSTTMVKRMTEKGLIRCEEGEKARLYYPEADRKKAVLHETQSFLDRVYQGSVSLMMSAMVKRKKEIVTRVTAISRKRKTGVCVAVTVGVVVIAAAVVIFTGPLGGSSQRGQEDVSAGTPQTGQESLPADTPDTREPQEQQEDLSGEPGEESQTQEPQGTGPEHTGSEAVEVTSQDTVLRFAMEDTVLLDMDGDGTKEELQVYYQPSQKGTVDPYPDGFGCPDIRIGSRVYGPEDISEGLGVYFMNPSPFDYFILDIDNADGYRELAIYQDGPSGDPETFVFRYADGQLSCIGSFPSYPMPSETTGLPKIKGDGTILSTTLLGILQTWRTEGLWKLNAQGRLEHVLRESYIPYAGGEGEQPVTLLRDLPVFEEKDVTSAAFRIKAGEEITFLQVCFDTEETVIQDIYTGFDTNGWIQVSGSGGTVGWIYVKDYSVIVCPEGDMDSREVFDNLSFAG